MRLLPLAQLAQLGEQRSAILFRDFLARNLDPFAVVDEVGRGEKPTALAAGTRDAVNHRASTTFAVGTRHVNHLHPLGRIGEELLE